MAVLTENHGVAKPVMNDETYLKAHRTATSLAAKNGGRERLIARTKGFEG